MASARVRPQYAAWLKATKCLGLSTSHTADSLHSGCWHQADRFCSLPQRGVALAYSKEGNVGEAQAQARKASIKGWAESSGQSEKRLHFYSQNPMGESGVGFTRTGREPSKSRDYASETVGQSSGASDPVTSVVTGTKNVSWRIEVNFLKFRSLEKGSSHH